MQNTCDQTSCRQVRTWLGVIGLLAFFLCQTPAIAAISPVVKARVIRDFGRISFEWPEEVRLKTSTQGKQLRITFEQAADINAAPILRALSPYITNVQKGGDGRSLILNLSDNYRVRSFVSGNVNGVDIVGIDASQKPSPQTVAEAKPAAEPAPVAEAPKPAAQPKAAQQTKPQRIAATPKAKPAPPQTAAPAKPTAKPTAQAPKPEPKKPAEPKAPVKLAQITPKAKPQTSQPTAVQKKVEEKAEKPTKAKAKAQKNETKAPEVKEVTKVDPPEKAETQEQLKTKKAPKAEPTSLVTELEGQDFLFTVPSRERVAVTAFPRSGRQFIYFNKPLSVDTHKLKAFEIIDDANVTPLGDGVMLEIQTSLSGLSVSKSPDSFSWTFRLSDDAPLPSKPIKTSPKTEPPLKPHLFMPVLQTSDVATFQDPMIGDVLRIVPSYNAGEGVFAHRDFVDFSLLPTAQGIVVKPMADELRVARLRNGLKITGPEGLLISADLPMLSLPDQQFAFGEGETTLFPYEKWKTPIEHAKKPIDFKNELLRTIADSTLDEKQKARIRLVQWHIAEGHAHEALGLLKLIQRDDPFLFDKYKLHAYRGAANFLTHRFAEAEQDFKHESLEGMEEVALWLDTLKVFFTGDGKTDYLAYYDNYVSKYPPVLRQQLALIAADHLINRKQYNAALKIFDTLNSNNAFGPIKDYADYLIAKVSSETRQFDMAKKIWDRLATDDKNRFVQVRARYALATMLLERNEISLQDAIDRLEPLRVAWRGDQFEVNLLSLLGELYETSDQPREALRIYRELLTYFPQRKENLQIAAHMADMFAELFNEGGADDMQPLDALALYYEFRDLTPVGDQGDRMVRNLADRLVAIDLLDRAADLLDHQVRFRSSGEERSRLGAQLALIYLLNRQPKQALDILEVTGFGRNPEKLQETRALLTARALADLGEHDRALALLDGNLTHDSEILKLRIFWEQRKWKDVVQTAESLISQRRDPSATINEEESQVLLKLAIGYTFQHEREQVQYLRDYFLPLMKENQNRELFAFITQDAPVNPRNMAQLTEHINNVETFLANYRDRIKEGGLDSMVQ